MKTLIEKLDPEGFGQISFDRFCSGIHDFLGEGLLTSIEKNNVVTLKYLSIYARRLSFIQINL